MSARRRTGWGVVSPGRLAEIIERMSRERRAERVAPTALAVGLGLAAIPLVTRAWARRGAPEAPPPPISDEDRRRLDERLGPPL